MSVYFGEDGVVHREVIEHRRFHCDICLEEIKIGEARYSCVVCAPLDNSFDACSVCGLLPHPHLYISHGAKTEPLCMYSSLAETVLNRLVGHREKRFIGTLKVSPEMLAALPDDTRHLQLYEYTTFDEVYCRARSLSSSPLLYEGAYVGIVGETSGSAADWIVTDVAAVFAGCVSVPLHYTYTVEQLAFSFTQTNSKTIFVSRAHEAKVREVVAVMGGVHLIVFGSEEWTRMTSQDPSAWLPLRPCKSNCDVRTLFFTSGSTGMPKGAMITDRILNSEMSYMSFMGPHSSFAYEPLGYATQRLAVYRMISCGGRLTLHSGNMETFFTETRHAAPTSFSAPPRMWSLLYSKFKADVAQTKRENPHMALEEVEKEVANRFKNTFGSGFCSLSTGGAITPEVLFKWMKNTFGRANVSEGYGCTECGSIASNGIRKVEATIRLEPIPELGYHVDVAGNGKGLLWVKTRSVVPGYFADAAQTSEAFKLFSGETDMFYNTGDIVEYDSVSERLVVIDRVKNLLRLASALFVAPEYLEGQFVACSLIQTCFVYAESDRDFVLVVVIPNLDEMTYVGRQILGPGAEWGAICRDPRVNAAVLEQIRAQCVVSKLQPFEVPRGVIIEPEPWTSDNGCLTVSFKLQRRAVTAKYRDALRALYRSIGGDERVEAPPLVVATTTTTSASDFDTKFSQIICEVARLDQLPSMGCRISEIGVDSVGAVHLSMLLKALGHKTPIQFIVTHTLQEIKDYGRSLVKETALDWAAETALPDDVAAMLKSDLFPPQGTDVFLTGATGFLGLFVLAEILATTEQRVICLVRGRTQEGARNRLKRAAVVSLDAPLDWSRIQVVTGDFTLPNLGMGHWEYSDAARVVSVVVHCGASVNGVVPYSVLRNANVASTVDIVRFATHGSVKRKVVFVSSLSAVVSGYDSPYEDDAVLGLDPLPSMGGYGASKRVSEILLSQCMGAMDVAIVRPGTIGPCATNGAYNRNDTLSRFIVGVHLMGCGPDVPTLIEACDVRQVATVVVAAHHGVYHACSHRGMSARDVVAAIPSCRVVSREEWYDALQKVGSGNPLYPLKEAYFGRGNFPLGGSTYWDNAKALVLLKPEERNGVMTGETVEKLLRWCLA